MAEKSPEVFRTLDEEKSAHPAVAQAVLPAYAADVTPSYVPYASSEFTPHAPSTQTTPYRSISQNDKPEWPPQDFKNQTWGNIIALALKTTAYGAILIAFYILITSEKDESLSSQRRSHLIPIFSVIHFIFASILIKHSPLVFRFETVVEAICINLTKFGIFFMVTIFFSLIFLNGLWYLLQGVWDVAYHWLVSIYSFCCC